jgi:hypothetical protein
VDTENEFLLDDAELALTMLTEEEDEPDDASKGDNQYNSLPDEIPGILPEQEGDQDNKGGGPTARVKVTAT